jgi:hypothetical protein
MRNLLAEKPVNSQVDEAYQDFEYPDDEPQESAVAPPSSHESPSTEMLGDSARLLAWILDGNADPEKAGRRALAFGYKTQVSESCPKNLAELGKRLGVTTCRACQIVSELNLKIKLFRGQRTGTGWKS